MPRKNVQSQRRPELSQSIPWIVVVAVVLSYAAAVACDVYFSIREGKLSQTLQDIQKQAFSALLGILATVSYQKATSRRSDDVPAGTPDDPISTDDVNDPAPASAAPTKRGISIQ